LGGQKIAHGEREKKSALAPGFGPIEKKEPAQGTRKKRFVGGGGKRPNRSQSDTGPTGGEKCKKKRTQNKELKTSKP